MIELEQFFSNPLAASALGGTIVAIVAAFLSRKQMQSEIEIEQLLKAYQFLHEGIFIADENTNISEITKQDLERYEKTNQAAVLLDLLGSKKIMKLIGKSFKDVENAEIVETVNMGEIQSALRKHIRSRLGLSNFFIPKRIPIVPLQSIHDKHQI